MRKLKDKISTTQPQKKSKKNINQANLTHQTPSIYNNRTTHPKARENHPPTSIQAKKHATPPTGTCSDQRGSLSDKVVMTLENVAIQYHDSSQNNPCICLTSNLLVLRFCGIFVIEAVNLPFCGRCTFFSPGKQTLCFGWHPSNHPSIPLSGYIS